MSLPTSPLQPKTRYEPRVTPSAAPTIPYGLLDWAAMMPATCVPWPLHSSSGSASGTGVLAPLNSSPTRSVPYETRQPSPKQPPRAGWR